MWVRETSACNTKLLWFLELHREETWYWCQSERGRRWLKTVPSYSTEGFTERDMTLWRSLIHVNNMASMKKNTHWQTHTEQDSDTKTQEDIGGSDTNLNKSINLLWNMRCLYDPRETVHGQKHILEFKWGTHTHTNIHINANRYPRTDKQKLLNSFLTIQNILHLLLCVVAFGLMNAD